MEKIIVNVSKTEKGIIELHMEAKGGSWCQTETKDVLICIGGLLLHSCVTLEKVFPLHDSNFAIVMKCKCMPFVSEIRGVSTLDNHLIELSNDTLFEDLLTVFSHFRVESRKRNVELIYKKDPWSYKKAWRFKNPIPAKVQTPA